MGHSNPNPEWKKVPLRTSLIELIDKAVEKGIYRSRAEFVADAVRRRLEELGIVGPQEPQEVVIGE